MNPMKVAYPDSSMIVPQPLIESVLKKAPKIPEVEKVLTEQYGNFPPAIKQDSPKKTTPKNVTKTAPQRVNPPHLGNKIDIIAK